MKSCALQMAVSCQIMTKLLRLSIKLGQESFLRVMLASCVVFGVGGWLEALNKVRSSLPGIHPREDFHKSLVSSRNFIEN